MENLNHSFYISKLVIKSFQQKLNESEKKELEAWLSENSRNQMLYHDLQRQNPETIKQQIERLHLAESWEEIEKQIDFRKEKRYLQFFKYAAILIIVLAAALFLYTQLPTIGNQTSPIAGITPVPGSSKAILILESGEKVELAKCQNFYLHRDSTVQLSNNGNILKIEVSDSSSSFTESYSILSVPKGGEYRLVLSDGSKVWINSDSRLRFPSPFNGEQRTVYLEGEAYFEIAHNSEKPFIVSTSNMNIRVLGTKFNVKAYTGDQAIYTTLVSGAVKTSSKKSATSVILRPNEQCIYTNSDDRMQTTEIDPQAFLGWVKGRFIFENETLEEILKQLSRWYDVDVFYQNPKVAHYRFTGNVDRFDQISTLLRMIEKTYNISFTIHNRTVIVSEK